MRDFSFSGYGFLPFGKRDIGEREPSLKEQLIERLEQRFKEHQASLRFITVGSLAMALSACKDDALVKRSARLNLLFGVFGPISSVAQVLGLRL